MSAFERINRMKEKVREIAKSPLLQKDFDFQGQL
jgi:hypothetical protein